MSPRAPEYRSRRRRSLCVECPAEPMSTARCADCKARERERQRRATSSRGRGQTYAGRILMEQYRERLARIRSVTPLPPYVPPSKR